LRASCYGHDGTEANHEAIAHDGAVVQSADVEALLPKPD